MDYAVLEQYLSPPRFGKFVALAGGHNALGWEVYARNLRVSRAIYPRLHLFEIFLRNAINEQIATHFSDPSWIITQAGSSGFMSHNSLNGLNAHGKQVSEPFYLKKEVTKAINKLQRGATGSIPPAPKVIADLTLGFWVSFFLPHHYQLLRGCPIQCFAHLPQNTSRERVHGALLRIRDFRNRVHHNEPIVGTTMADYKDATKVSDEIETVSNWINPELAKVIKSYPVELA